MDEEMMNEMMAAKPAQSTKDGAMSTKADANYRDSDGQRSCDQCEHFLPPNGCAVVEGKIGADGLCDLFSPTKEQNAGEQGVDKAAVEKMMFGGGDDE